MMQRLFVYGTLAPGRENAHVLNGIDGRWEDASVTGRLYPTGWGAALGFPGLVPDAGGDEVRGLLFGSEQLAAHWQRLDAFEGDGYVRVVVPVRCQDGSIVEAFVYALSEKPSE